MSTFSGFSEEELKRIKHGETNSNSVKLVVVNNEPLNTANIKRVDKLGFKFKRPLPPKVPVLQKINSDDAIDNIDFEKCKLSLKPVNIPASDNNKENIYMNENVTDDIVDYKIEETKSYDNEEDSTTKVENYRNGNDIKAVPDRRNTTDTPDIVRGVDNYSENELAEHKVKLEELQLRQKIMEEQNKKRKEMLAKALADRTKQTTEEVLRLEKIKKELQVLDSQFSQDVAVLRGKIDQACLSYADAEKQYLRVEKEFLQAKIHLQKEREKKELLTEHLCALITHNETRKAQKLETLMLELATDKKNDVNDVPVTEDDDKPVVVDGVDERTGKIMELIPDT